MGLICCLKGHDWGKPVEVWTGDAYGVVHVEVANYTCSRCGKTRKTVRVTGKLSRRVAEDIVDSTTGVVEDNLLQGVCLEPEPIDLTQPTEVVNKRCKKTTVKV